MLKMKMSAVFYASLYALFNNLTFDNHKCFLFCTNVWSVRVEEQEQMISSMYWFSSLESSTIRMQTSVEQNRV